MPEKMMTDDLVRQLERELYANATHQTNATAYVKSNQAILDLLKLIETRSSSDPAKRTLYRDQFKEKKIFSLAQKMLGEYRLARQQLEDLEPALQNARAFLDAFCFYRVYEFESISAMEDFCLAAAQKGNETKALFAPAFLGKIDLNQMASDFEGKTVPAKGVEFPIEKIRGLFEYLDARKQGSQARLWMNKIEFIRQGPAQIYVETENELLAAFDEIAKEKGGFFGED